MVLKNDNTLEFQLVWIGNAISYGGREVRVENMQNKYIIARTEELQ